MGNNRSRRHRVRSDVSTQMTDSLLSEETRLETFSVDRLEEPIHSTFVSAASCTSVPDVDDNQNLASRIDLGMNQLSTDNSALLVSMPPKTCSLSISSLGDPYQLPNMKREDSMLFHYCKTYIGRICCLTLIGDGV